MNDKDMPWKCYLFAPPALIAFQFLKPCLQVAILICPNNAFDIIYHTNITFIYGAAIFSINSMLSYDDVMMMIVIFNPMVTLYFDAIYT